MAPITLAAVDHLCRQDPTLKRLIETTSPLAYDSSGDLYYDLISCVVDQQIHYRAIQPRAGSSGFARLLALFPGGYPHPAQLLRLPEEQVLALKISAPKYQTLLRIATRWLNDDWAQIDWLNLPDETIRQRLSTLKGVGPWTIDMLLLFTGQRADVFPIDDYQLKKTLVSLYRLPADKSLRNQMNAIAQTWSPYSSLACQYVWAWAKQSKPTNPPL